jgi:hypothetical protein
MIEKAATVFPHDKRQRRLRGKIMRRLIADDAAPGASMRRAPRKKKRNECSGRNSWLCQSSMRNSIVAR